MYVKIIMKKNLSLLLFLFFVVCWSSVVWADTGTKTVDTQIDSQTFNQASAEVQSIEVNFCGEVGKTKKYTVIAGEEKDICLEITNNADKDILVSMDFVDGTVTNDQWKNRACMDNNKKEKFGQYISGIENTFVVPAKGNIIKHPQVLYPKNTKGWEVLGCLVYYTKGVSLWWAMDFNILVRRAKFIDITITKTFRDNYKRSVGIVIVVLLLISLFLIGKKSYIKRKRK